MAVAALVLGIFGTILCWFPAALLGVPLALVGLILGILARKNATETQQPTGMATAGMVISIVGLTLGILLSAMCFACTQEGAEQHGEDGERSAVPAAEQRVQRRLQEGARRSRRSSSSQQPSAAAGAHGALQVASCIPLLVRLHCFGIERPIYSYGALDRRRRRRRHPRRRGARVRASASSASTSWRLASSASSAASSARPCCSTWCSCARSSPIPSLLWHPGLVFYGGLGGGAAAAWGYCRAWRISHRRRRRRRRARPRARPRHRPRRLPPRRLLLRPHRRRAASRSRCSSPAPGAIRCSSTRPRAWWCSRS